MPIKLATKQAVGSHYKPIRCLPCGMTTADVPPKSVHAFRLWCAGVPKEQAEDYAEFVKVRNEIEGDRL